MYQKWTGPLLSEKRSDVGMIFAGIRFVPAFTDGIVRPIFARQDPDPFSSPYSACNPRLFECQNSGTTLQPIFCMLYPRGLGFSGGCPSHPMTYLETSRAPIVDSFVIRATIIYFPSFLGSGPGGDRRGC